MAQPMTIRAKDSTAWAKVYPEQKGLFVVYYYRSDRVKNPSRTYTPDPEAFLATHFAHAAKRVEAKKNKPQTDRALSVGDVLYNGDHGISFYRVTKLVGKLSVEVQEIGRTLTEGDFANQGRAKPNTEELGKVIGTFRSHGGMVKAKNPWGTPLYLHKMADTEQDVWFSAYYD